MNFFKKVMRFNSVNLTDIINKKRKMAVSFLLALCLMTGLVACKKEEPQQSVNSNETVDIPYGAYQGVQTDKEQTANSVQSVTSQAKPVVSGKIANVVNGGKPKSVLSVEELVKAIDSSGNTVITLLQDISCDAPIELPYSCTIDFAGHTITITSEGEVGLSVINAGKQNATTTLKNGVLRSFEDSIRVMDGAVVISNMKFYTANGYCVALYDTDKAYLNINRIENSTLASAKLGCLSYSASGADYSGTGITVTNTNLIAYNKNGAKVFNKCGDKTSAGLVKLSDGTVIYSYANIIATNGMNFSGFDMVKTTGASVTVDGASVTGINKWTKDTGNTILDVLMIGNSFCSYFTDELYGVADAAGVQLNVHRLYEAGCYVKEHWEWLQADARNYTSYRISNAFGSFEQPDNLTLKKALAFRNWDMITLQQHFGNGVANVDDALNKCTPYVDNLYSYIKANNPKASLYWHTTWAYQTDHESMPKNEQKVRQDNIISVSDILAKRNKVNVIPSGQAWKKARENPRVGDTLCQSDFYHDGDVEGGQYLNACVWFEVLTRKSCIDNKWRPDTYRLSEDLIYELQDAAHSAVKEVYGAGYVK